MSVVNMPSNTYGEALGLEMAPQLNVSIDLCAIIQVVNEDCGIFCRINVKNMICNIILHF